MNLTRSEHMEEFDRREQLLAHRRYINGLHDIRDNVLIIELAGPGRIARDHVLVAIDRLLAEARRAEDGGGEDLVTIGQCGGCEGPVVLRRSIHVAACPCGRTTINRAFMDVAAG